MAEIKFDEPQYNRPSGYASAYAWPTRLVIKLGLAKDGASAQRVLTIVLLCTVVATVLILFFFGSSGAGQYVPPPPDGLTNV
jgi:hypothetical protein